MNLTSFAFQNIKRNIKRYIIYFFSLSFSVFTAYSFFSLMQNKYVMMAFTYDNRYQALLKSFGMIIMVFVLFFLLSSNKSFIKARKKEISTYALFGMTNGRIGKLLFMETMIVGIVALLIGIFLGIFFSKLLAMILLSLSVASYQGDVEFTLSIKAILLTASLFLSIFSLMGLSGLHVISRFELVDLFKAQKVSEGRLRGSSIILAASLILIGAGYYLASNPNPIIVVKSAIPILFLVICGTYLFFWGGLPKVLSITKRNKNNYYKGVNLISTSAFSHRMKSIGSVMATIAVLSAVASTAIATGYTLYKNIEVNTYDTIGYDMYFYGGQEKVLGDVTATINHHSKITDEFTVQRFTCKPEVKHISTHYSMFQITEEDYFRVFSESTYNKLIMISKSKNKPVGIQPGEAVYLNGYISYEIANELAGKKLTFSNKTLSITSSVKSGFLSLGAIHTIVISDDDFNDLVKSGEITDKDASGNLYDQATFINYKNALRSRELNNELTQVLSGNTSSFRTAYANYDESLQIFGLICFIGFFMSAVFILMTASLLYFKQIVAAEDERHQYKMLRKIGIDEQIEKKVITKRLVPVFLIPLLIGILHSIFAMKTADTLVFSNMIQVDNSYLAVLACSAVMYGVYAAVYGIFYFITKNQYSRIVK